jgi:hypothetical protein
MRNTALAALLLGLTVTAAFRVCAVAWLTQH